MKTETTVEKQKENVGFLTEALKNAELLLEYSAKHGLKVKEEWVSVVIASRRAEQQGEWTSELEIKFWIVYKELSALAKPVSVESLKSLSVRTYENPGFVHKALRIKRRPASSTISVRNYLILALIFIVILLLIQVFSLKGTTLLNSIEKNKARINQIEKRKLELRLMLKSDENNERAKLERYSLESESSRLDQEIASSIELLRPWVLTVRSIVSFGQNPVPEYLRDEKTEAKVMKANMRSSGPGFGPPSGSRPENNMNNMIAAVQEAQNFTQIIQLYILPLLYGLIGGFVFVLRGLAYDIKNRVFSAYSNVKYALRVNLGALAGIIVGLLWSDIESTQITFFESFSTGAIAFIAGYGVEYVLNGLDNLIANFSGGMDKVE